MAEYPMLTPVVGDGLVHGRVHSAGRKHEATVHVFPSGTGQAVLVVRNSLESGAGISAATYLDDDGRRQLIELLGGTA